MDSKLIFLISQPRAGSTLLQRMLASHPAVYSLSEPWLMLHPIYALKDNGIKAEYDSQLAHSALKEFFKAVPKSRRAYLTGLNQMFMGLYEEAIKGKSAHCFLDKTPRYYLIIEELAEIFPKARFVFLLRNPLAVLASVMRTWVKDCIFTFQNYSKDLLVAPGCLARGLEIPSHRSVIVRYEQLTAAPHDELEKICELIGIDFRPDMVAYNAHGLDRWEYGDQGTVYKEKKPLPERASAWKNEIRNAQTWRFASDYLRQVGPETFGRLGYSYEEAEAILASCRPSRLRLLPTVGLASALKPKSEYSRIKPEKAVLRFKYWLQQKCG